MNFEHLINLIDKTHNVLQTNAIKAVNRNLTIRNWLVGFYIKEFEQNGEDRAKYGEKLLQKIAKKLDIKGLAETGLKRCRLFYLSYPKLGKYIIHIIENETTKISPLLMDESQNSICPLPMDEFLLIKKSPKNKSFETVTKNIYNSLLQLSNSYDSNNEYQIPVEKIIEKLSFTHICELIPIDNPLKRTFYEIECIKGTWSVEELKRQINSLYFERSGMSQNPEKLSQYVQNNSTQENLTEIIKQPFVFEFLGLKSKDVVYENDLEQALIENISEFLLEFGSGICFEARQKRILIGDEYFFIDLVFYHRILKCHILVELKVTEYKYEYFGQLKTYINYYRKEIMQATDNPPVGILLVTNKNNALVEYAIADNDQQIFITKYLLELPPKEELKKHIDNEIKNLNL